MAYRLLTPYLYIVSLFFSSLLYAQPHPLIDVLCDGNESLAKLSGGLLQVRKAVNENKATPARAFQTYFSHAIRDGQLQCIIGVTEIGEDLLQACGSAGLEIVGTYEFPGVNHVVVRCSDPAQLEPLAARADVLGIAPESKMIKNVGSVENQADVSMNADDVRNLFGFDGTGVRVGALSDSINDTIGGVISAGILTGSSPQNSGDLPAQVRVLNPGPGVGTTDEGAGMMELIYDLAPGCALSFASASTGYSSFANNIDALVTDPGFECDVIVDDVFYSDEPVYQDGLIALAADAAFAAGVPYFSSAGNQADNAHERTYVDSNAGTDDIVFPPTGNDFHDFGLSVGASSDRHLGITVAPLGEIDVLLKWDEPHRGIFAAGGGAESDLNLYLTVNRNLPLVDADATPGFANPPFDNVVGKSEDIQGNTITPQGEPIEAITYTNPSSVAVETVFVVIDHVAGREPVEIYLQVLGDSVGAPSVYMTDRTIIGHAAAENAMAVAAMFYGEIDSGGSLDAPSGQLDVESFSSLGGNVPIHISADGLTRFGSPQLRFKPEITAPDGTNTTFFGTDIGFDADTDPNFFGTSAAAPHAAAVAALMLNANPGLTAAQVYSLMRSSAIDAETTGPDFLSGDGLVDAFLAVLATDPVFPASNANWDLYR